MRYSLLDEPMFVCAIPIYAGAKYSEQYQAGNTDVSPSVCMSMEMALECERGALLTDSKYPQMNLAINQQLQTDKRLLQIGRHTIKSSKAPAG